MIRRKQFMLVMFIVMLSAVLLGGIAMADDGGGDNAQSLPGPGNLPITKDYTAIHPLPGFDAKFELDQASLADAAAELAAVTEGGYAVGDTRWFLYLDAYRGRYVLTKYTVAYIGDNVEVWVQQDLNYYNLDGSLNPIHPNADDAEKITPERIQYYADIFENTVRPLETDIYGPYADRDGSAAFLPGLVGLPADYYVTDNPQRVVILVSNIRDNHFYDPINSSSLIAGFVSPTLNFYMGRSIFTIDSQSWDTRLGPPNYDWEGTLAHEFQHLIGNDSPGGFQDTWMEEGLAEFAEFLVGYRPSEWGWRTQFQDHPENSLVLWGDQNSDPDQPSGYEILADYHQASVFLTYLAGRLRAVGLGDGADGHLRLVAGLQRSELYGPAAIDDMLSSLGAPFTFQDVWSDFRVAMLHGDTSDSTTWGDYLSQYVGPTGIATAPQDLERLRRNYTSEGYDTPGMPPLGSDYLNIGWSEAITEATTLNLMPQVDIPTGWSVMNTSGLLSNQQGPGGTILYSGHTDLTDNFIIFPVSVPAGGAQLTFDTMFDIEEAWDYGFVQVTTDTIAAEGFVSLPISGTVDITDPDAHPIIVANVPGFSGVSGGSDAPTWLQASYDLADYAGQDILLAFRYSTDWGSAGNGTGTPPGWYLDNIKVGDQALFTDEADVPANAMSIWQARGLSNDVKMDIVTFEDGNGVNVTGVYSATANADGSLSFNLGSLLTDPGFDGPGERVMALLSGVPPARPADLISAPTDYVPYHLTGMPPGIYASRVHLSGTAHTSNLVSPRSYPGDNYNVRVTVDNFGKNGDIEAAPAHAWVAIELPPNSTYVDGSATATVASGNITYTTSLQSVDAGLPDTPGVYWHGPFTKTVDVAADFTLDAPLATSSYVDPIVHIANAPFGASPSQHMVTWSPEAKGVARQLKRFDEYLRVISPLALTKAFAPTSAAEGDVITFQYVFVNQDDATRDVDFSFELPTGVQLVGLAINSEQVLTPAAIEQGGRFPISLSVPSTVKTGLATTLSIDVVVGPDFVGDKLNLNALALQPGSELPWADVSTPDVTVTRVPVTVEVPLLNDTWLDFSAPNANRDGYAALILFATGQDNALLTFDRSGIPADATITSATLTVNAAFQTGAAGKQLTALNVDSFDPLAVTYANGVGLNYFNPSSAAEVPLAGGTVSLDVTGNIAAWNAGGAPGAVGQLALSLTNPLGFSGRLALDSLETWNGSPAKLTVTYVR